MEYWNIAVSIFSIFPSRQSVFPIAPEPESSAGAIRVRIPPRGNTGPYWASSGSPIRENIGPPLERRPEYEKIFTSRGNWEWLYCDESRGIRWNIAWALGKSLGLRPRDFPLAQAIFHCIPLLSSQYSYKISLFGNRKSDFPVFEVGGISLF